MYCEVADKCTSGPTGTPCLNDGISIGTVGNCKCQCSHFWEGPNCETPSDCDGLGITC
jgi:hypothetical protein